MTSPSTAQLVAALGDPRPLVAVDGIVSPLWPARVLESIVLPDGVPYCGDMTRQVLTCRVHKLLVPSFRRIFARIAVAGWWDLLRDWGGTYEFRTDKNNPARLSAHCWGAAVDLNPIEFPNGSSARQDQRLLDAFAAEGFLYGGDYHLTKDPMHWESSAELLQRISGGAA